jgi:hypothetical protein
MNNIISISGFGWSGSTAARDLIKEYSNISHFSDENNSFKEYSLSYDPYGFIDLYSKLVQNWNFLNIDKAIKDHITYFNSISSKKSFINYHGLHLDDFFNVNSKIIHNELIQDLTSFNYSLSSRVNYLYRNSFQKIIYKILSRTNYYENSSRFSNLSEDDFFNYLKKFHKQLFRNILENDSLLLEKAIPVNNLELSSNFFDNLKILIIDRDPRDTFVEMSRKKTIFWGSTNNITDQQIINFANWKKTMSSKGLVSEIPFNNLTKLKSNSIVLKIKFEDLVNDYENSKILIEKLIDKSDSEHIHKNKFFNPNKSKNNIGLWKKYSDQRQMSLLTSELGL